MKFFYCILILAINLVIVPFTVQASDAVTTNPGADNKSQADGAAHVDQRAIDYGYKKPGIGDGMMGVMKKPHHKKKRKTTNQ